MAAIFIKERLSKNNHFGIVVAASGVGYLLYNLSIKEIGPTRTSSIVYSLVPKFVAILALMFFTESITIIMILSVVLVLAGLNLMLKETNKQPES